MNLFGRLTVLGGILYLAAAFAQPRIRNATPALGFETNAGQAGRHVQFISRGPGYTIGLASTGAILKVGASSVLRIELAGAAQESGPEAVDKLPGVSNYFFGSDPKKWRTGLARYAKVRYPRIYPGTDIVYHGADGRLEYDFLLDPGADPGCIRLVVEGAREIHVDSSGDLVLGAAGGELRQHKPVAYQEAGGVRTAVAVEYLLRGDREVGFRVGAYDRAKPMVIDPTLAYSTYLGGSGLDAGNGIAVDSSGNIYVAGETASIDFPSQGAYQPASGGGSDAFITKFDNTGAVVYSTYLGGSATDRGLAIAVDSAGSAYVTGTTASGDFPTMNATQPVIGGGSDAFVAELDPTGAALVFSTYLGGSLSDTGNGIALDALGNIYVAGETSSSDFPVVNPLQPMSGGLSDIFVAQFAPSGSAVNYATYLGGAGADRADAIAVDSGGNAYITGRTGSRDFPLANPIQPVFHEPGDYDAYVAEIDATGSVLVFSTYLGGSDNDQGFAITVDSSANIYVAGGSASGDFATPGAFQTYNAGSADAFVAKINATPSLVYATLLGGGGKDHAHGIAVDSDGSVYVAGRTGSIDFWIAGPIQDSYGGGLWDAFVSKLDSSGSSLLFSTFLGGGGTDRGNAMALDASGVIYVTGDTNSVNFPISVNAAQGAFAGGQSDAFVMVMGGGVGLAAPVGPPRRGK